MNHGGQDRQSHRPGQGESRPRDRRRQPRHEGQARAGEGQREVRCEEAQGRRQEDLMRSRVGTIWRAAGEAALRYSESSPVGALLNRRYTATAAAAPIAVAARSARKREGCVPWILSATAGATVRTPAEAAMPYFARSTARSSCAFVMFERPSIFSRFACL